MKRNLLLAMMLTFAMLCGAQTPWDGTVAESYAGGDGTAENPFQIATAEQLAYLAQQTNNGTGLQRATLQRQGPNLDHP